MWIAGLLLNAYLWSAAVLLPYNIWTAVPWTVGILLWARWQLRQYSPSELAPLKAQLLFKPFLFFVLLFLLVTHIYPATVHDSVSYRIPRQFIWLQEGHITHVPVTDERLNTMPYNWGLAALPLLTIDNGNYSEVTNVIAWVVFYLIMGAWVRTWTNDAEKARWLALIAALPMEFVLQAPRGMNDMYSSVLLIAAGYFIVVFEEKQSPLNPWFSLIAFTVAAGTKPQYCVFGLPWVLWFLFSPSRPWRVVNWRYAPLVGLGALATSPLNSFWMNYETYGSWTGPAQIVWQGTPLGKFLGNFVMMVYHALQPPLVPLASRWNTLSDQWLVQHGITHYAPLFNLHTHELPLVDNASLGLCYSLAMILGAKMAWKTSMENPRWLYWLIWAGVYGFIFSSLIVSARSIARSLVGFVIFFMPFALWGLAQISFRSVRRWGLLLVTVSAWAIIFTPTNPLWPVKYTLALLDKIHAPAALLSQIRQYDLFAQRYYCGEAVVAQIPSSEKNIGAITGWGEPLMQLWYPPKLRRHVTLFPREATLEDVKITGLRYFVIGGAAPEFHDALIKQMLADPEFTLVIKKAYTSSLSRKGQDWLLLKRTIPPGKEDRP